MNVYKFSTVFHKERGSYCSRLSFVILGRDLALVVSVLLNLNQLSILRRSITYLGCVLTQFSGKDTSTNDCRFAVDFLYKSKPEYTVNQAYS